MLTFVIALVGAVLGAASLILHVISPYTRTTVDDRWRDEIDMLRKELSEVLSKFAPKIMVLLFVGAASASLSGCGPVKTEGKAALHTVVDCGIEQAVKATREWSPALEQLLQRATGADGHVDWPSIDDATKNLSELGWCALENTVSRLIRYVPTPGAPQSSPTEPAQLEQGLAELRAKRYGATEFKPAP